MSVKPKAEVPKQRWGTVPTAEAMAVLPAKMRDDLERHCQRRDLFIVKQRNGPTGPCELVFVKPWMRFIDAHVDNDETPQELPQ